MEDLIQNSGQARPKVLFNHTFFSQSNGQKFTMQALNNYIEEQKGFAETKLLTQKMTQLQKGSRELMAKQSEYLENRMEQTERYQTEISNILRDYDLQVNQIPSFLTTKLLEHSDKRSVELLGRIPIKEEAKPENEDKGNESDNTSSKRRGRSKSPVKQKKNAANTAVTHLFEEDYSDEQERPKSRSRSKSPVKEPPKPPASNGLSKAPPQLPKISNGPTGKASAPFAPPKNNVKVEYEENPRDREFDDMLKSKSYQPTNPRTKPGADKLPEPSKGKNKTIDDFLAERNKSKSPSPHRAQEPKRDFFKKQEILKEEPPKKPTAVEEYRKAANQTRVEEEPKSKNFQISPNKPTTNSFFKPKGTQDVGTFRSKVMANYDENYNSNDFYAFKDKEQEEEEEKDWFEDDFGKLADIAVSKTKKNTKSSQSTISTTKKPAPSKEEQEKVSKTKKKKREDSPQRSPGLFLDDEEDAFNPLLKKSKKSATTNKRDKSPDKSPTGRGGGKKNSFFL
jgi:hypothetical protein